ncbi:hypothetical protein REPUB_Repub06bG0054900 [Reevesia pubescens]
MVTYSVCSVLFIQSFSQTLSIQSRNVGNKLSYFSTSNIDFPSEAKFENFDEYSDNDNDDGEGSEDFDGNTINGLSLNNEGTIQDMKGIMGIIHETGNNYVEMKNKLELCGIMVSSELVVEVLSRVWNDWQEAFTFFLWAGKQPSYAHSLREYNSMISILGKMRKFDTAWALIDEMRGGRREAERVWREMSKRGVRHDVVSYASVISCYSKACNLYKVLKLFSQMKLMGIEPDRKVYNAVIHALAKARHVKEAINLMKTVEEKEAPLTYNSDLPCFLRILRNREEVFELLQKMRKMGCQPTNDTYIMLIRKFSRWCQFDNVFKLWNEMNEKGVDHDRSSYIVLIHGLFLNGKLDEAYKYYMEMKEKQLLPEPKIDEMLKAWVSGKQFAERKMADLKNNQLDNHIRVESEKFDQEKDFVTRPETRRVVRERGFSFWEQ